MAATVLALNYFTSPAVYYRRKTSILEERARGGLKSAASRRPVSTNSNGSLLRANDHGRRLEKKKMEIRKISKDDNYDLDDQCIANDEMEQRLRLKEYIIEHTKDLIRTDDDGPPRWYSPLDHNENQSSKDSDSPLLLHLPGLDGVGLGLISHHHKLGKVFDVWCLHIPVNDRTAFEDMVQLVDWTVKEESRRSPNKPIYLVGESIGGCLALAIASRNPTIDLILILANPATSFRKSRLRTLIPFIEAIPEQFHTSFPYILATFTVDPLRMAMAMASGQRALLLPQTIEELSGKLSALISSISVLADALPRDSLLWKLKMLKSASSYANSCIHDVKAQTLVLASGKDQLLPSLDEAERLSDMLPDCQIRYFNDSAHALFMEAAFDLLTVIKGSCFYRRTRDVDYASDFIPPTPSEFKQAFEAYRLLETIANPVMLSTLENGKIVRSLAGIPSEGPVLLVGNHMLMGLDLLPILVNFLSKKNISVRGLAHPMFFQKEAQQRLPIPSVHIFRMMGTVPVSAGNFYRLLATGSHVLLYPGGIREAQHLKGEENKLFWPLQSEFVRMAATFGAKIIPFGVVGSDDFLEVLLDYNDQMRIPPFKALIEDINYGIVQLRGDAKGEVANQKFHLPVFLPKLPGRFYFLFGKPIETEGMKNELRDRGKAHEVYMHVKSEVERSMDYLKEKREQDPYRTLLSRLIYQASHGLTSEIPTFEF